MVASARGTITFIIPKKSTVLTSNQKKYQYKIKTNKASMYTYRFFSTLFITAVACKVSKIETLVSVEAAEGSLCIAEVEGKTACSKSNEGLLSICWSKFVKNPES